MDFVEQENEMPTGSYNGAGGKLLQMQLMQQAPELQAAQRSQSLANMFSGEATPTAGGGFLEGLFSGRAMAQEKAGQKKMTKKEEKAMAHLERMAKLKDYQTKMQAHQEAVKTKLNQQKLATEEMALNQKSIEQAAINAMDFGDVGGLNQIIEGNPNMKDMLQSSLPEGSMFDGVRVVDGEIVPVGKTAEGTTVFGSQTMPLERFLTDETRTARLNQRYKQQQMDIAQAGEQRNAQAFPAQQELREANTYKANAEARKADVEARRGPEYKDAEIKLGGFAQRVEQSGEILDKLVNEGKIPNIVSAKMLNSDIANLALSSETQEFMQAQRNLVNSVLRRESGAVISEEEFDNAKRQYIPMSGDSKEVLSQKRQNRDSVLNSYKIGSRGFYDEVKNGMAGQGNAQTQSNGGIDLDAIQKELQRRGG